MCDSRLQHFVVRFSVVVYGGSFDFSVLVYGGSFYVNAAYYHLISMDEPSVGSADAAHWHTDEEEDVHSASPNTAKFLTRGSLIHCIVLVLSRWKYVLFTRSVYGRINQTDELVPSATSNPVIFRRSLSTACCLLCGQIYNRVRFGKSMWLTVRTFVDLIVVVALTSRVTSFFHSMRYWYIIGDTGGPVSCPGHHAIQTACPVSTSGVTVAEVCYATVYLSNPISC